MNIYVLQMSLTLVKAAKVFTRDKLCRARRRKYSRQGRLKDMMGKAYFWLASLSFFYVHKMTSLTAFGAEEAALKVDGHQQQNRTRF